ncbi:Sodium/proline symporter [Pelotomaculum schinkii]|uniref:Sodium/proline symporter n=1 Tax=Pelotomaculum schinkii TaxID=78350 RepID=A0A4Y7RBJ5_9FIRM|nr:sodium/proline symporter PutP [Pelotomaculum schinkii]TEB06081.1 Sodium/proline symporter [Pelotomaculum schinkii]
MSHSFGIIAASILYLTGMLWIGVNFSNRTENVSDYILGSRGLNKWVTSLSAEASDMSGWLLLGLPGYAYLSGMEASWIALGLALGTYANWKFVAKRLRNYTQIANDSLTLPDYLENRFRDSLKILRSVAAVFILIFFLIYTSSGFVAGGKLFNTVFGLPYIWSMLIGAAVVVTYTFLGGFMAVCWTDFVQGILMFFAILIVPITGMFLSGGPADTLAALKNINPELLNPFTSVDGTALSLIAVVSLMAWGLGYFGQPHILVRFMAIHSADEIKPARHIAMVWVILSLAAAVLVGMVGRVYLPQTLEGAASETVFMVMTNDIFASFIAGIILSAILAAIMSTASSQLLVTASAIGQDFYKSLIRKEAGEKELVSISRWTVIGVAIVAGLLAIKPDNLVLDLVAYAWAGFGATFGPTLVMSLFWKRMTKSGALAGIIAGGITVLVWKQLAHFGGIFALYEIVPGFIMSVFAIIVVSMMSKQPSKEIMDEFERVNRAELR